MLSCVFIVALSAGNLLHFFVPFHYVKPPHVGRLLCFVQAVYNMYNYYQCKNIHCNLMCCEIKVFKGKL